MVKGELDVMHFRKIPLYWEFTKEHEIPIIKGIKLKNANKLDLVTFNTSHRVAKKERKYKTVEFFQADYLFERIWTYLDKYTNYLSDFKAVLQPDFSLYTDMPLPLQLYNHYRKQFIAKYYQEHGIKVIPVACWSDERSYDFCFEGIPKNSLICVSSVGIVRNKKERGLFVKGYKKMIEVLKPSQILWYGRELDCIDTSIEHIFAEPNYDKLFNGV